MSAQCEVIAQRSAGNSLGLFERYLTLWVFLCILAGIDLGSILPQPFQFIGGLELAKVNIPVAVLLTTYQFASNPGISDRRAH